MSDSYLIVMPTDELGMQTFAFEHAMAHRTFLGAIAPLDRFSVIPYFIDPQQNEPRWRLNHQQAHIDALPHLPAWYGWDTFGVSFMHNLLDYDLDDEEQRTWWTFANQQEHYAAMHSLPAELTYPFW